MESFAIIVGIASIVLLAWGIRLIRIDLEKSEKEIDRLVQENLNLMEENFNLKKQIRTNKIN